MLQYLHENCVMGLLDMRERGRERENKFWKFSLHLDKTKSPTTQKRITCRALQSHIFVDWLLCRSSKRLFLVCSLIFGKGGRSNDFLLLLNIIINMEERERGTWSWCVSIGEVVCVCVFKMWTIYKCVCVCVFFFLFLFFLYSSKDLIQQVSVDKCVSREIRLIMIIYLQVIWIQWMNLDFINALPFFCCIDMLHKWFIVSNFVWPLTWIFFE
jgi:hypothetical protein